MYGPLGKKKKSRLLGALIKTAEQVNERYQYYFSAFMSLWGLHTKFILI